MYDLVPKTAIQDELDKILKYKGFNRSPLLSRFLQFVVENTLDGKSNQIKEYTVATRVLGKPNNFNPQLDASVRINAIRLRNLLSDYYREHKHDTFYRIELPKGNYIPTFTHNEKEHEKKPSINLVESDHEDTICIIPFSGLVQPQSLDFSITGFCEFLSQKLSLFQDIKVVSFHSALQFTKEGGRREDAGTSLGVSYYLTGSIELEKDQLLISFQLFDAQTNVIIWSQQTSASLLHTGMMEAIDTISNQIVASLAGYSGFLHYRMVLDKNQVPPLSNKMANAIFWFYNYHMYQTEDLFHAAIKRLEEVVSVDEDCSLCWAVLAHLYADALIYNYSTIKPPLPTAQEYVNKAFKLDPNCQHAFLVKGWLQILLQQKSEAMITIEKIDELNPNSPTFKAMCSLGMAFLGEYSKSHAYLEKAKLLNPLPYWWMNLPELLLALKGNDYNKIVFLARKSSTPSHIFEHVFEMIGLYYLEDLSSIKALIPVYYNKYPDGIAFLIQAFPAILFDKEVGDKISYALQEIEQMNKEISSSN